MSETSVEQHTDTAQFRALATPVLRRSEAEHNLLLGLIGRLDAAPADDEAPVMVTAARRGEVIGAALMTRSSNLIVSHLDDAAAGTLAEALHTAGFQIPGVHAAPAVGRAFADRWVALTGCTARERMRQGLYRLTAVTAPTGVTGEICRATEHHRELGERWLIEFALEALGRREVGLSIDRWLDSRDGGLFLWMAEGEPVAMAGAANPTGSGIRISAVYTPPQLRRRGYAGALVAGASQAMLDAGYRWCFLYTDLRNPTSNRIYQRVGYELVCDAADLHFERPALVH